MSFHHKVKFKKRDEPKIVSLIIVNCYFPTVDIEPSLLKLFRNLWFYIALFGLAPPLLKSPTSVKPNSTTLNNGGNTNTVALQAVGGPYMWNPNWSIAVQRISQGTPPLVCLIN